MALFKIDMFIWLVRPSFGGYSFVTVMFGTVFCADDDLK